MTDPNAPPHPPRKSTLWRSPVTRVFLLITLIYAASLAVMPKDGLWIMDNVHRLWIMKALIKSGYTDFSIPWPGRALDPGFEWQPFIPNQSLVKDGKLYSTYPPVFPALTAPLFQAFGYWGLYILPLLGGLLALAGISEIGRRLGLSPPMRAYAMLAAGLGTPIWFYSLEFWEHTLALGLIVWGAGLLLHYAQERNNKALIASGILFALSVYLRGEHYLLCAVATLLVWLYSPGRRLRSGLLMASTIGLALLPLWIFNLCTSGHPLGFHVQHHHPLQDGFKGHLATRASVFYSLFVSSAARVSWSFLLTMPYLLLYTFYWRFPRPVFLRLFPILAGAAAAVAAWVLYQGVTAPNLSIWIMATNSLFAVSPVLILGLAGLRDREDPNARWLRLIWLLSWLYTLLYALFAPEISASGLHWGNRFLLVAYPFLVLLGACHLQSWNLASGSRRPWVRFVVSLPVVLSILFQVYSIRILYARKRFVHQANQAIRQRPETVIATAVWYNPYFAPDTFYERSYFWLHSQQDFARLREKCRSASGSGRILVLMTPKKGQQSLKPVVQLTDTALQTFSVDLFSLPVPSFETPR